MLSLSFIEVCMSLEPVVRSRIWLEPPTEDALALWKDYRRDLCVGLKSAVFKELAGGAAALDMLSKEAKELKELKPEHGTGIRRLSDDRQLLRIATLNRMIFEAAASLPGIKQGDLP